MAKRETDAQRPALFLRESTGLVKNVSLLDAIAINTSYMSIAAALALVGFTMVSLPGVSGVNLVYGSAIAALLAVPQVMVYSLMNRRMARTGGDYVWLSRSLGGFVGSTVTFMGITLETMPYLALIALSTVFAIGSVGASLGSASLSALAGQGVGIAAYTQFALASSIFAILIFINILRPKVGFKLISVFWAVGVLALVAAVAALFFYGQNGVSNYINGLGASGITYSSLAAAGASYSSFNLSATLLMMPFFALFSYPWFNAAQSVGSELKGRRTITWNAPISLVATFLLLTIPFLAMYYAGGFGFVNAALANQTLVSGYSFNFWTLAMGVSSNILLKLLIGIGWVLLTLGVLAFGIITISRYLLAQSFDRFLPASLAYVSPKYRSPIFAHLLDLVVTIAIIGLASFFYGTIVSLEGAVLASMIYFAFVGAGAFVYASREKGSLSRRTKEILQVAGILQAIVFIYLSYEFLAYPQIWGGNLLAYGYIVAALIAGIFIYFASRSYHAKKGINIAFAFKEIPPE